MSAYRQILYHIIFCTKAGGKVIDQIHKERDTLVNYIKNLQEHHKKESFYEEIVRFFKEHGIDWDAK